MMVRHSRRIAAAVLLTSLFTPLPHASAQLPATRLVGVFPAGAKSGTVVEVSLDGKDLDDVNRLLFSHAGIAAKQKTRSPGLLEKGPQPVANQFVVSVAANVPPGVYEVRAAGRYGTSNPCSFVVGNLAEKLEVEPNNDRRAATTVSIPTVVNGRANQSADVDFYRFAAKAGQRIIVSAYARRIGSIMDSVVTVYDSEGRQLGVSRDDVRLDSLVDFTAGKTGDYFLKINDTAYRGGPGYGYRISIGALPHVDFVFPPAALPGGTRKFTVYGRNLPAGRPSNVIVKGQVLQQQTISIALPAATTQPLRFASLLEPAAAGLDATEYRITGTQGTSNPVLIGLATARPVLEKESNNSPAQAQKLVAPCEVMGQFYPQRDRDWYELQAKKGQAYTIEVISQRLGFSTDANLLIQQVLSPASGDKPERVRQVTFVNDTTNTDGGSQFDVSHDDPTYRFTAPTDATYRLMVSDSFSDADADPRRVYRLAITNGNPDYRLAAISADSHSAAFIRKGGQLGIRVIAFRRNGFAGEIRVKATGLPAGVTANEAIIGPGSNIGMLTLIAASNAAANTALIQVSGQATIGKTNVTRIARFGSALEPTTARSSPNQRVLSVSGRIVKTLAISVAEKEQAPITLQAGGGKVWETSRGGKLKIPYTRGGTFPGQVRFIPRGLPANVTARLGTIGAKKTKGEFEISLRSNTPTGTYTFFLDSIASQVNYRRNPEAAARAAARKKEVDEFKKKADAAAKAAAAAKSAADRLVASTSRALTIARNAQATADAAAKAAMAAEKKAASALARAKAALAAKPTDANLRKALATAEAAAKTAATQLQAARTKAAAAKKTLLEETAKSNAAAAGKKAADKKATETATQLQAVNQLQARTNQLARTAATAARPRKLNVPVVSTPITIKITPAPIRLAPLKAPGQLQQGKKLEIPISITRLYKYKGQVNISVGRSPRVSGLSIANTRVPANKSQARLVVTAAKNATVGSHTFNVRATMNVNGQNVTIERTLSLVIRKAAG